MSNPSERGTGGRVRRRRGGWVSQTLAETYNTARGQSATTETRSLFVLAHIFIPSIVGCDDSQVLLDIFQSAECSKYTGGVVRSLPMSSSMQRTLEASSVTNLPLLTACRAIILNHVFFQHNRSSRETATQLTSNRTKEPITEFDRIQ